MGNAGAANVNNMDCLTPTGLSGNTQVKTTTVNQIKKVKLDGHLDVNNCPLPPGICASDYFTSYDNMVYTDYSYFFANTTTSRADLSKLTYCEKKKMSLVLNFGDFKFAPVNNFSSTAPSPDVKAAACTTTSTTTRTWDYKDVNEEVSSLPVSNTTGYTATTTNGVTTYTAVPSLTSNPANQINPTTKKIDWTKVPIVEEADLVNADGSSKNVKIYDKTKTPTSYCAP